METPILIDRTVHLCLDMQRLFAQGAIWSTPWMTRVTPDVVRIAEAFRSRNVFTRFIPAANPANAPGMWHPFYQKWQDVTRERIDAAMLDLIPELQKFAPPSPVFDKATYSAFHDGHLHAFLREKDIRALVISGAETDICVLATVLDAVDHGYRTILVEDAVCSSSDAGHEALMTMYRTRLSIQIELATTSILLEAMGTA
jgi:nicotinamidase-related amidase